MGPIARNEQPAGATLVLNHPLFHPPLTAQFTTSPLERRETALHVQFSYRPVDTDQFTLTLFGGPSRIRVQQRVIEDLDMTETFNPGAQTWSASIDDVDLTNESAAAWGLHVGADGSYFFSRYVGVGGLVRYSRATVSLADPIRSLIEEDEVTTDEGEGRPAARRVASPILIGVGCDGGARRGASGCRCCRNLSMWDDQKNMMGPLADKLRYALKGR